MKKIIFALLLGMMTPVLAEDISTNAVLLQALDKTTGRTSFLTVRVNEKYQYGDLNVLVEKCLKRPPEETPENSVFVTITEKDSGTEVFRGWMFSSEPALSAMDHAVYDIWVVECIEPQKNIKPIVAPTTIEDDVIAIESIED